MEDEKIDLHWGKFFGHLIICIITLISAIFASRQIFGFEDARHAIAKTNLGQPIGALLIMGTFLAALWMLRVPYRKDVFERRLRNWDFNMSIVGNLLLPLI